MLKCTKAEVRLPERVSQPKPNKAKTREVKTTKNRIEDKVDNFR